MQYFFILGKNPTLSLAELVAVLDIKPEEVVFLSEQALVLEIKKEIKEIKEKLIKRLGGTIKVGIINFQCSIFNVQSITNFQCSIFNNIKFDGKFKFGISYYGRGEFKQQKILAMELKKALKEKGVNSRWVTSREKTLSSVVVETNKLTTEKGMEIVIIRDEKQCYIGKTVAVQPFKELSRRDYGRPRRDDYSGMLPPKLAQILINLTALTPQPPLPVERGGAKKELVLLDPFCGSGTILTEAMLMNFKKIIGCDNSEKAVQDTKENIEWTKNQYLISNIQYQVLKCEVRELSKNVKVNSIDAIVTEPYLGPSRMPRPQRLRYARRSDAGGKWNSQSVKRVVSELEQLYHQTILEFEKVLRKDACAPKLQRRSGRVVMVWPVFKFGQEQVMLSAKKILSGSGFNIVNPLHNFKYDIIKLTNRQTMIYGRERQRVWREIVILKI